MLWLAFGISSFFTPILGITLPIAIITLFLLLKERNRKIENNLKDRANHGDAQSQYDFGHRYLFGCKHKYEEAWWYKLALALGLLYKGVGKDSVQGVHWLEKAANQGHVDAQYELGMCYLRGDGVGKDDDQVFNWLNKSAAQGHRDAQYQLARLEEQRQTQKRKDQYKQDILSGKIKVEDELSNFEGCLAMAGTVLRTAYDLYVEYVEKIKRDVWETDLLKRVRELEPANKNYYNMIELLYDQARIIVDSHDVPCDVRRGRNLILGIKNYRKAYSSFWDTAPPMGMGAREFIRKYG